MEQQRVINPKAIFTLTPLSSRLKVSSALNSETSSTSIGQFKTLEIALQQKTSPEAFKPKSRGQAGNLGKTCQGIGKVTGNKVLRPQRCLRLSRSLEMLAVVMSSVFTTATSTWLNRNRELLEKYLVLTIL